MLIFNCATHKMQRQSPLTPKSKRFNRSGTSEPFTVAGSRFVNHRATMASSDILPPGFPSRDRIHSVRQSFLDTTRKPEPENKNLELNLLYDKYLQTTMMKLLMKDKAEETEKIIVSQLGLLAKEEDAVKEKLSFMTMRERDIKNLTELQDYLDMQIVEIKACLDDFDKKPVEILTQLQTVLASLDILKCKNIIIPETTEEMQKIHDLLVKCGDRLHMINNTIGSKSDTIKKVSKGLEEFTKTYGDVQDYAKKTKEVLEQLQILVLKEGARAVHEN